MDEGAGAFVRARGWLSSHRTELLLLIFSFFVLASFSNRRFWRQSEAPHFVYQAQAWLEGRFDLEWEALPNLEDWACVRTVGDIKTRCIGRPLPTDKWYVSFPPFPAVVMLPFVAVHGYQLNDTSFTVAAGALALLFFYSLLRFLRTQGESRREDWENVLLAGVLGFGTVFFCCAIRGEVWFTAEILGVLFTCLYLRFAVSARKPFWAGLFFSMAALCRTPLLFSALFFLWEGFCHRQALRKLGYFVLGALPLGVLAAGYNQVRFGRLSEFGHSFLFNNRVNADIDRYGLFSLVYFSRNLEAAFLLLPKVTVSPFQLSYDPRGLSLFLTLPLLLLLLRPKQAHRLTLPLWLTVAACALPGFFYQNTGYMQFGFRFSLDYTPYLVLLLAVSGWSLKQKRVASLLAVGFMVNFWGAAIFHGYTELMRRW